MTNNIIAKRIGALIFCITNHIDIRYFFYLPWFSLRIERLRCSGLKMMGAKIGQNSYIRSGLFITYPAYLTIGNDSKIGVRSELYLYTDLIIGDNVEAGSDLIIHTSEHLFSNPILPLTKQGSKYSPVYIGSDVYIGSRVIILPGVTIGDRVVIASGSIVAKDLKSGFIYAGIPSTPIRELIHSE
jgi:maltose O-acetyltransferase